MQGILRLLVRRLPGRKCGHLAARVRALHAHFHFNRSSGSNPRNKFSSTNPLPPREDKTETRAALSTYIYVFPTCQQRDIHPTLVFFCSSGAAKREQKGKNHRVGQENSIGRQGVAQASVQLANFGHQQNMSQIPRLTGANLSPALAPLGSEHGEKFRSAN